MSTRNERWLRRGLLFDDPLWQRLKARAEVEGTTISTLVRDMLYGAIEAREVGPGAVGSSKADRLLDIAEAIVQQLGALASMVSGVGRSAIGSQRLLVHWATREDALGVNKDDLDAELQAVGAEGWAQVLDELREPSGVEQPTKTEAADPEQ
jgi:hypothetical protein